MSGKKMDNDWYMPANDGKSVGNAIIEDVYWTNIPYIDEKTGKENETLISHVIRGMEIVDMQFVASEFVYGKASDIASSHMILCKSNNRYFVIEFRNQEHMFCIAEIQGFVEGGL